MGAIVWGRMFVINKHEEVSASDIAQSEMKKWIVHNSDVIEDEQRLDADHKSKDEEAAVLGNLNDAIKFKKNHEDDLDVESHNKAFISYQYDDNDSVKGKSSIIEQHQQISQMQKRSNRSGVERNSYGKKKSKKSEKNMEVVIMSKKSGNENEEKNGKDSVNTNNMSKQIRNSLDSGSINEMNNNLTGNHCNNDNGTGTNNVKQEEAVVQKEERKVENSISRNSNHYNESINKVYIVANGNQSKNNEINESFHNNDNDHVIIEHDKDKEQQQSIKEDDKN